MSENYNNDYNSDYNNDYNNDFDKIASVKWRTDARAKTHSRTLDFNEHLYAASVYQNGFLTKRKRRELGLLALYMRDELNYSQKKQKAALCEFCQEHWSGFNMAIHYKTINSVLTYSKAKKNKLTSIPCVSIYANDMNFIERATDNTSYQKLLFTLLVENRLQAALYESRTGNAYESLYFGGSKTKWAELRKNAKVPASVKIHEDFVPDMDKAGLIKIHHNGAILLDYLKDCKPDGKPAFHVMNYSHVGWHWDYCMGVPGMTLCRVCAQPFKKSSKDRSRCPDHKDYR